MNGFYANPAAFAFKFAEASGFYIKPEAFAFEFADTGGFYINPEAFAFEFADTGGFYVKPEAFAFEFSAVDSGFHVKPAAYAFDLSIIESHSVLWLAVRHNGKNVLIPFIQTVLSPAVVIRWDGIDWYNLLVSPTSYRASIVKIRHNGKTLALSKD